MNDCVKNVSGDSILVTLFRLLQAILTCLDVSDIEASRCTGNSFSGFWSSELIIRFIGLLLLWLINNSLSRSSWSSLDESSSESCSWGPACSTIKNSIILSQLSLHYW